MACLGGRAELSLLQTATGRAGRAWWSRRWRPPSTRACWWSSPGAHEAVRFRHDRIREAILRGLDPRGGAPCSWRWRGGWPAVPELFAVAAEQYLPVVDAVDDPAERRAVVGLLRRAADQASLIGDYALVNALLAAALRLIDPGETATLLEVHTGRHAALYSLGRLDEADEEYRTIEGLCPTALERADATACRCAA